MKENLDGVEEIIDVDADIEYQDNIEYLINKAKENSKDFNEVECLGG